MDTPKTPASRPLPQFKSLTASTSIRTSPMRPTKTVTACRAVLCETEDEAPAPEADGRACATRCLAFLGASSRGARKTDLATAGVPLPGPDVDGYAARNPWADRYQHAFDYSSLPSTASDEALNPDRRGCRHDPHDDRLDLTPAQRPAAGRQRRLPPALGRTRGGGPARRPQDLRKPAGRPPDHGLRDPGPPTRASSC